MSEMKLNEQNTPPSFYDGGNQQTPKRQSKKRSIALPLVITLASAVVVAVLCLWYSHSNLVSSCEDLVTAQAEQIDKLKQLLADNKDKLEISTDDVRSDDKSTVNLFQARYKQAEEEIDRIELEADSEQCSSQKRIKELKLATIELEYSIADLDNMYTTTQQYAQAVSEANELKLLDDAKSALDSVSSATQTLSRNQSLSAKVRTQLNRAVLLAQSVADTDDIEDINEARTQLESILSEVNDSLNNANAELLDIEKKVAAIKSAPNSEGSYADSAMNILSAANLQPVWGLERMRYANCNISNEQVNSWLAGFCTGSPQTVYISTTLSDSTMNDAYFADAMRHEIAHYLIYRRCGTPEPTSIGSSANSESTASSYAVLYLGANANTLNRAADSRYHMTRASDEAAVRIHAGQCY